MLRNVRKRSPARVSKTHDNDETGLTVVLIFVTRSSDCPVAPTKWKYVEGQRIKKQITRNVNRRIEEEIHAVVHNTATVTDPKKKKSGPAKPAQVSLGKKSAKPPSHWRHFHHLLVLFTSLRSSHQLPDTTSSFTEFCDIYDHLSFFWMDLLNRSASIDHDSHFLAELFFVF